MTDTERYHSLDALRAFALLLGVVFHAAESFMAGHLEWAIVDSSPSFALDIFRHASHSFRMEIFFLIAGFFARLLYLKRGWKAFCRNRFSRIIVPLVVGWMVLYPLLVFIWIWGAQTSGNWIRIEVPPEYRSLPAWKLTVGFFASRQFIPNFDLTHLWFLHQLAVIYALVLGLRALLLGWIDRGGLLLRKADGALAFALRSLPGTLLLIAVTVPILLTMESWSVDTPLGSLWPHWPTTLLYGFIFICGWLLHRQPCLLKDVSRQWRPHLFIGILLILPTRFTEELGKLLGLLPDHLELLRLTHTVLYAVMMWTFTLGFTGLFTRFAARPSRVWRYVADSSYWVYLIHLPVIVALQVWLAQVPLHWSMKLPLILLLATPVLFLSYHHLVRPTFIGQVLNGRRYPRRRPSDPPPSAGEPFVDVGCSRS